MSAIIRKLDPQRRMVVPQEALYAAGIKPGDLIEVYKDIGPDGLPCIVLQLYRQGCALCGKADLDPKVGYYKAESGKLVCTNCITKMLRRIESASKAKKKGE